MSTNNGPPKIRHYARERTHKSFPRGSIRARLRSAVHQIRTRNFSTYNIYRRVRCVTLGKSFRERFVLSIRSFPRRPLGFRRSRDEFRIVWGNISTPCSFVLRSDVILYIGRVCAKYINLFDELFLGRARSFRGCTVETCAFVTYSKLCHHFVIGNFGWKSFWESSRCWKFLFETLFRYGRVV